MLASPGSIAYVLGMPTYDGLETSAERKLSNAERETVRAFLALLSKKDLERLKHLVPLVTNEPAWWLREELTKLTGP